MTNTSILKDKKLFVLDMDGTFYLGEGLIEGSLDFIEKVRKVGKEFLFFTNNSSRNPDFYRQKLLRLGCDIGSSSVVTSGDVTINYLKHHYPSAKVYLIGTPYLEEHFKNGGINLVDDNPDVVVVGFDTTLTYEKLTKGCTFIRNGSTFIATHLDFNCPTEDGFLPDCGAMCALITASTGVEPKYLGKPFKETVDAIIDTTGYSKEEIVFVGDRLYTDIAIGVKNDATSILVLSGETKKEDLEKSEIQPDFIFNRLVEVSEFI